MTLLPVLAIPNLEETFVLEIDALSKGIGDVLMQVVGLLLT